MLRKNKVGIIIVGYRAERYIDALFSSLSKITLNESIEPHIIYIDNDCPDHSSIHVNKIHDTQSFPYAIHVIRTEKNLGFAGGNNIGIQYCIHNHFDYVYLLNQDTEVDKDFLINALVSMQRNDRLGAVQSLLLYADNHDKINSGGNAVTFWGIGYSVTDGVAREIYTSLPRTYNYLSGAGMLLSVTALIKIGLFRDYYFMYHEDLELSMRLQWAGFQIMVEPKSIVYHKYIFSSSIAWVHLMERNRFVFLLTYYDIGMLILLIPAFVLFELGTWPLAIVHGWGKKKFFSYKEVLRPSIWKHILHDRKEVAKLRQVSYSYFYNLFFARVDSAHVMNPILKYIGNPCMELYWKLARSLHKSISSIL